MSVDAMVDSWTNRLFDAWAGGGPEYVDCKTCKEICDIEQSLGSRFRDDIHFCCLHCAKVWENDNAHDYEDIDDKPNN